MTHVPLERLLEHRPWVRALARALVADPNAADDLEQETWLAALTSPPRDDTSPRGWLGTVMRRRAAMRWRSQSRRARHETAAARLEDGIADTGALVAETEVHGRVVQAVLALPEPEKSTVLLRFFEGLPPRGVAERMGVPVETVRSRTRRALERLRARLDAEHGGDDRAWRAALVPLAGGVALVWKAKAVVVAAAVVLAALAGAAALVPGAPRKTDDVARAAPAGTGDATTRAGAAPAEDRAAARDARPPEPPKIPRNAVRVALGDGTAPPPGTVVTLYAPGEGGAERTWTATAGADGIAQFPDDAPERAALVATLPGYARVVNAWFRLDDDARVVCLAPGHEIDGLVVDADGDVPVVGAEVRVEDCWFAQRAERESRLTAFPLIATLVSGGDGRFRIVDLPTDTEILLTARRPGYAPVRATMRTSTQPAGAIAQTLRLHHGAVAGGVVRTPDGAVVADAEVLAVEASLLPKGTVEELEARLVAYLWGDDAFVAREAARTLRTRTASDGSFEFTGVPFDAPLVVVARTDSWGRSEPWAVPGVAQDAPPPRAELRLRALGDLRVKVLGPKGEPAAGADVRPAWNQRPWQQETPSPGEFLVRGLDAGAFRFVARGAALPTEFVDVRIEPGGTVESVVRLPDGLVATGLLVYDDRTPVADARVTLDWAEDDDGGSRSYAQVVTGADGRWRAEGLRPGRHKMWVQKEGIVPFHHQRVFLPLASEWRLVMERENVIRARVVLPEGMAVPVTVDVARRFDMEDDGLDPAWMPWAHWRRESVPWNGGALEWRAVPGGSWIFRVFVPGCRVLETRLAVVTSRVADAGTLQAERAPEFSGRVIDESGRPVAGAAVSVSHPDLHGSGDDNAYETTRAAAGGEFRGTLPLAGTVILRVHATGFVPERIEWTPVAGKTLDVVQLTRGALLRGRVRGADGKAAADTDLRLSFRTEQGERVYRAKTGPDGRFEIRLPPGRARIWARDDDEQRTVAEPVIPGEGETSVEFKLLEAE